MVKLARGSCGTQAYRGSCNQPTTSTLCDPRYTSTCAGTGVAWRLVLDGSWASAHACRRLMQPWPMLFWQLQFPRLMQSCAQALPSLAGPFRLVPAYLSGAAASSDL